MKIQQLLITLALGLGLILGLLWILGTGSVLAVNFNVTKFTDGNDGSCTNDCSLREAIQAANATPGPDTITLLTGTHTLTITGAYEDNNATGDLDITEALTITGAGPDVTIIDASGLSDRVLHVLTGPVVISSVTIRNGSGIDQGGGILNEATLMLTNSTIISNSASDGGGIFNDGGVLALTNSTIISNTANESGGGIKNDNGGVVELTNSTIIANRAIIIDGGGIDNLNSTVKLANSTISGNTAKRDGGGIDNSWNSIVELTNSTVSSNTASYGGGIADQGTVRLTNCTISSNTAYTNGGGINTWENSIVELANSTVSSNTASYGGGLLLCSKGAVLTNTIVADNQANIAGSGLYIARSSPRLLHTTIAHNGGDGSGVYITGTTSTVALTNTILVSHTVGITVAVGNTATLTATLWGTDAWANLADWGGAGTLITGTINLWDAPDFVDPDAGDYHIGPNSAAIDAGVNAGVDDDIDGGPRPMCQGYDIGADERCCVYLPIITKKR